MNDIHDYLTIVFFLLLTKLANLVIGGCMFARLLIIFTTLANVEIRKSKRSSEGLRLFLPPANFSYVVFYPPKYQTFPNFDISKDVPIYDKG